MGRLIFFILVVFTFCSCTDTDAGFDLKNTKEIKNSWAWKIFIWTEEGEFTAVKKNEYNLDNTTIVSPIFAVDILGIYGSDYLLFEQAKKSVQ